MSVAFLKSWCNGRCPKNSLLNSFAVFSTPPSPNILYSLPSSPLKKLILSINPKIFTPVLSNIWIPLFTSRRARSWGVETIIAPSTLTSCAKVNCVSPVPGGISTMITSLSFHKTFCVIVFNALITIGPLQIIGVCSSTKKPIDIHWASYFSKGINALPSSLLGFSFKSINFGREGP